MNIKKRLLALLLGFIIITNVTFTNCRNAYAIAIADDAVAVGVILMYLAMCGIEVANLDAASAGQLADDFINYLASSNLAEDQDLYAEIIDVTELYRGHGGGNQEPNRNKSFLKIASFALLAKKAHDFFDSKFNSSTGVVEYPFTVVAQNMSTVNLSDLSAAVKSYADSYYNINADVNYIAWSMQGSLRLYDSPKYIYLFDKAWPDSAAAAWLCLIASDSPDPTYYDKSSFRCYSGTLGARIDASDGRVGDNSWDGCGVTNQSATLLTSFYYDPAAESGTGSSGATENKDISVSPISPLKMTLNDFLSKLQSKFKVNDLTGEPEIEFDPNHVLDPLSEGSPLQDVLSDINQDAALDPDPDLDPSSDTNPYPNPTPASDPNLQPAENAQPVTGPVTVTNTGAIAYSISQTYGKGNVDLNKFKIKKDLSTTFPFSLPWDIMRILRLFVAEPVAPVFEFDFSGYFPFNQVPAAYRDNLIFRLDLSEWNAVIKVEKFFVTIGYALFLITITRSKMIRG